jgi:PKD repeat protein
MKKSLFICIISFCMLSVCAQQAGFTFNQPSKCAPSTVNFTNTSSGNPIKYMWNFGDGFTSALPNPIHPFITAGIYAVELITSYPNDVSDTVTQMIEILGTPVFSYTLSKDSICPNDFVSFAVHVTYPASSQAIKSYYWDMGDGGVDTTPNPTYQFKNIANMADWYNVSLTITDTNGCSTKLQQSAIFANPKPMPNFGADKQYFCYPVDSPAIVHFINQTTTTTNNTYSWMFSNGEVSSLENPVITLQEQGNYAVSLTATSPQGCTNSISKVGFVEVMTFTIQYAVSDTLVCSTPSTITFRGLNGGQTRYYWDFGDGKRDSSFFVPYSHTYGNAGTYQVTIMAKHSNNTCLSYDTITIRIYDSIMPVLYVNPRDTNLCNPNDTIIFKNNTAYTSNDDFGLASTVWDFGDGTTASGDSVMHIYGGQYGDHNNFLVTMSVTTPYGCKLVDTVQWIHVFPIEYKAGLRELIDTIVPFEGCVPLEVQPFINTLEKFITSSPIAHCIWYWDYLNNPQDTTDSYSNLFATHIYEDTGIYFMYLKVINEQGCEEMGIVSMVFVGMPPAVGFTFDYREDCFLGFHQDPFIVYPFDSLDANGDPIAGVYADKIAFYEYDGPPFPKFITSITRPEVPLSFSKLGLLTLMMLPSHYGCPGNWVQFDSAVYVCPPAAGIQLSHNSILQLDPPFYICGNDTAHFIDASGKAISRRWFFGDALKWEDQSTDTAENADFCYYPYNAFVDSMKTHLNVWLTVYNDDSLDVNSPTYNRCGYCEDTMGVLVIISTLDPKFSVSGNICQGDSITFYDSTTNETGFIWKDFGLLPHDMNHPEYVLGTIFPKTGENVDMTKGYSLYFAEPNTYTVVNIYRDSTFCDFRFDSLVTISIHPGSKAGFSSSMNNIHFHQEADTLCANAPDTLFLRDESHTDYTFEETKIVSWEWVVNKDTFFVQNPVFVDTTPGLYDVKLHIINEHGCVADTATEEGYILINKIKAQFASLKTTYCNREEVQFVNQSYIQPYEHNIKTTFTCEWDFGDGTPIYRQFGLGDVTHVYDLPKYPDTVEVALTVFIDGMVCSDTYIGQVVIVGPMASFTDNGRRFPCPGNGRQIQFYNTSTGDEPIWFYWNFGDMRSGISNESNLRNPVHDYFHAGTYDITLIVGDATGCVDTLFSPEYVFIDGPVGSFTYGELSGCIDHRVVFTPVVSNVDTIKVNPDRASEIVSSGAQINDTLSYVYQTPGAYLPYFYLIKWIDDNGVPLQCVVEWAGSDTIYAIDIFPDFATDSLYCSQSPVVFSNTTTFLPDYLAMDSAWWDFGNGDSLNAIDGYTLYNATGSYRVDMTAHIMNCSKQISKTVDVIDLSEMIHVGPDSVNTCDYSIAVNFIADTVNVSPLELSPQYRWTFDDGDIMDGNSVIKTFTASGDYSYQLTVYFGISNCIKTYLGTVVVRMHAPPVAEFEAIPQTVNYGQEIQFMDKSVVGEGNITDWYWNFGDTTNSNEQNPVHAYHNTSGFVITSLRIEDEFGCRDSVEHEVLILESLDFPNLFSPVGADGKKYVFKPLEEKGYFKEFQIEIYNKWGNSIWSNSCTSPNCPDYSDSFWWDGYNKWGRPVEDGVYYWVVYAIPLSETDRFTKNGSVTVISKWK